MSDIGIYVDADELDALQTGKVDSVTGSGVDNSDPLNPIVIFGSEYNYIERLTSASSTGAALDYLTLTTNNLPSGNYKLEVSWIIRNSSTSGNWYIDITEGNNGAGLNTSLFNTVSQEEPKDAGSDQRHTRTITRDINFTAGIKNINIELDQVGQGTATIYYGCIRLFRVS